MANNFDPSLSWSEDEVGSTSKLNAMVVNDNTMYNLIPHFIHEQAGSPNIDFNDSQSQVLKPTIMTGRIGFSVRGGYGQSKAVIFPAGTFAPSCRPVVVTQIGATGHEAYTLSTIQGTDGTRIIKSDGFKVSVYHRDGEKFQSNVSIHYIAFGWQEA